jgi:hypothetical protein
VSDRMILYPARYGSVHPEHIPWPCGFQSHGRKTRAEMLTKWRDYYERQKQEAELALDLADDELTVHTFLGTWARRNEEEVTDV